MDRSNVRTSARRVVAAFTFVLASGAAPAAAQQGIILGRVVDGATGQPLQGAQVFVVDGPGGLTDNTGRYRLTGVPIGAVNVRATTIGYRTATLTTDVVADQATVLDFRLEQTAVALDGLIITATGQQRAREVANAVGSMNVSEQLEKAPATSLMTLLQSKMTGVTIRQGSGSLGAASSIKIRGNTSLGLDNTPLIYIDGARIDNSNNIGAGAGGQDFTRLNDLSPDNIASIELVKGPAAATLYGTEASAGVIRITTKRGLAGDPVWSFRTEQSWSWDRTDWWSMAWSTTRGAGLELLTGVPAAVDTTYVFSLLEGDDVFEAPFQTGHQQSYGASVRGGTDQITYFLSGDYFNGEGVLAADESERYNFRANFDATVSEKLFLNVTNGFARTDARLPTSDNSLFSIVGNSLGTAWQGGLRRSDPNDGGPEIDTCLIAFELARSGAGGLQDLTDAVCSSPYFVPGEDSNEKIMQIVNTDLTDRYTGSLTATHDVLSWLTNRYIVGYDHYVSRLRNVFPVDPDRPFGGNSDGFIQRRDLASSTLTLEGSAAATFEVMDDLESITTVGVQFNRDQTDLTSATGRRFPAGSPSVGNSVENEATDAFLEERTLGIYVQEQLGWKDRLFLTPAVRIDDNSAFGEDLGAKAYPRVGFSWVLSEEDAFPELFDQFRLRAAWGQSGKQPGPNDALALLQVGPVAFRNTDILGFSPDRPGNAELKPETGTEFEIGFDAGLLDSRLSVEFTYFDKRTEDAVVERPDALSLGFPGDRFVNVGEVTNSGFELVLDGDPVRTDAFAWNLRGSLTTLKSEVTDLPEPIVFGTQRHQEGLPFGAYYDRPVTIDSNGDVVVAPDGEEELIGQPTPEWEGAVSTTLTFFNRVRLFALFDYQGGHQLFNGLEAFNCGLFGGGDGFGSCPAIFETGPDGQLTDEARIKDAAAGAGVDSPFIYDADFVKLRQLALSLDVPREWMRGFGGTRASVTFTGENLFTWTDYPGTDPEANFAGSAQVVRQQLWTLPQVARFSTRLTLTF